MMKQITHEKKSLGGLMLLTLFCLLPFSSFAQHWGPWPPKPQPKPRKVINYDICFPKDVITNSCGKTPDIPSVFMDENGDDRLAVNITDKIYRTSSSDCYKIFRTYTVMNWTLYSKWCQLDPMSDPYIVDREQPLYEHKSGDGVCVLVRENKAYFSKDTKISTDDYEVNLRPLCDSNGGFHFKAFMYTQVIKVQDNIAPVVNVPTLKHFAANLIDCKGLIDITFSATDNCSDKVTLETSQIMIAPNRGSAMRMPADFDRAWSATENKNGTFTVKVKNLPIGKHDLLVVVRDLCGNLSKVTRIPFEIRDDKGPAPICINGLSTSLMSDGKGGGRMVVWAKDFIASPIYDCNGQGPQTNAQGQKLITQYSINRKGGEPEIGLDSLVLTCADAGKKVEVEIHAWDQAGNHDWCITYVLAQNNAGHCITPPGILGSVTTPDGTGMKKVIMLAQSKDLVEVLETDKTGFFEFKALKKGDSVVVRPFYQDKNLDGILLSDLNLILDISRGRDLQLNPYQLIAADVNEDGKISTDDYMKLRNIILGRDSFARGTAWRFVDASFVFPKTGLMPKYPDSLYIANLNGSVTAKFIAIKLGDIDGSAGPKSSQATEVESFVLEPGFGLEKPKTRSNFSLAQNQPNPFQDETTIQFQLQQAGPVEFSVWDLQGKKIYQTTTNLASGVQQIQLDGSMLGQAKGVLYYTLRTAQGAETKRMLRF
jgi:hypothetical protein